MSHDTSAVHVASGVGSTVARTTTHHAPLTPRVELGSVATDTTSSPATRIADYVELTKPRIAVMATVTVAVGYVLGSAGEWALVPFLHAALGILLVAASSSALNQWIERSSDALMDRTAERPLPAGRLSSLEVLLFGLGTGILGIVYLAVVVNLLTAGLAALTLLLYVAVYTPLKPRSGFCTTIGAIPGALPPVLGWTAAGGSLDGGAFALFATLFLWQFPHFLAIAWLYREQYARAGMRMVPFGGTRSHVVGMLGVVYAVALIPVSLLPSRIGLAGNAYFVVALGLGLAYLALSVRFARYETPRTARQLVYGSLLYLPLLLGSLVWNHVSLLQ